MRHPVAGFAKELARLNWLCICDRCHETHRYEDIFICDGINVHCKCGAGKTLRRIRCFADSNSDWLDDRWPVETLARFLDAIRLAPNVDVILLTKRIEDWKERITLARNWAIGSNADLALWLNDWLPKPAVEGIYMFGKQATTSWPSREGNPPAHVWGLVSVENQKYADERIPLLLRTPFAVRGVSVEPLLEAIHLPIPTGASTANPHFPDGFNKWSKERREDWFKSMARAIYIARCEIPFNWVIVGGESGPNRRDCGVEAIVSVAEQCRAAGVPCYVKQASAMKPGQQGDIPSHIWALKQFPDVCP